jgi:hypothetical protein
VRGGLGQPAKEEEEEEGGERLHFCKDFLVMGCRVLGRLFGFLLQLHDAALAVFDAVDALAADVAHVFQTVHLRHQCCVCVCAVSLPSAQRTVSGTGI